RDAAAPRWLRGAARNGLARRGPFLLAFQAESAASGTAHGLRETARGARHAQLVDGRSIFVSSLLPRLEIVLARGRDAARGCNAGRGPAGPGDDNPPRSRAPRAMATAAWPSG